MNIRASVLGAALLIGGASLADETCNSPYMTGLIKGQEDFIHVWTLGIEGVGDGSDKLVTIDVNPKSASYGKPIHSVSVGERGEAHHMGFTDDRKHLWAGSLDSNQIYVFDVGTDPSKPRLVKTITDLGARTGYLGPHTFYALPGRMLIGNISNVAAKDGVTGMALYNNQGDFVAKFSMPVGSLGGGVGDGYGYDLAINPARNAILTSSFTGWNNYMRDLSEVVGDPAAMKKFGNTMAMWDLKAMQARRVFEVPGAPLEIRWSLREGDNWAITATALTSKLWLIRQDKAGEWQAKEVATIGDPAEDSSARRHLDIRGRQGPVGQYVHGRHDPLLRSDRSRAPGTDIREADRQAGQHGLAKLGWETRLHHVEPARKMGQEGRR
jgi:selenium-binding protein 1